MRTVVSAISRFSFALTLLSGMSLLWGQDASPTPQASTPTTSTAPDNTGTNKRDRDPSEVTAQQQKENPTDRELTRQIRKALVADKSLSIYAHNIKVIAQNGTVTLKGPVKTDEEKKAIEAKAAEVAGGADKIKSEIEVAGQN
jgi:hyperosmotically inducible protein